MIRAAIVGYGNIGRGVLEAATAAADFEIAGIVRRSTSDCPPELVGIPVVEDVKNLPQRPDVAILCAPSRLVPDMAMRYLALGIPTVDSFDVHTDIWSVKCRLDAVAKEHGVAAILSAGWDPGTDSMVRAILEACAPKGLTYTNFGPGMSMGHSTAVKNIEGVENALAITLPAGGTGRHSRMIYVQLKEGANFEQVAATVKADPYFVHDDTTVEQVPDVDALIDMGHGVNLVRKGVSGITHGQRFELNMSINNPALTSQILVGAARAVLRQRPGCYTMIEIPPVDLLCGEREELIHRLV